MVCYGYESDFNSNHVIFAQKFSVTEVSTWMAKMKQTMSIDTAKLNGIRSIARNTVPQRVEQTFIQINEIHNIQSIIVRTTVILPSIFIMMQFS